METVLWLPNLELPFEVQIDASDIAFCGVLMQEGHLVAFECYKLNGDEHLHNTHEKEIIVVVTPQIIPY